ncbi:MAG TPA: FtsX-like permease family protein [Iamia sp.]|nr:FtsX-like permease family protein [Iamia sp.]
MLRTALTTIAARKLRLLATSVAVLLGVAFMAGTFVLTDTIGRSFDRLFDEIYSETDTVVQGEEAFASDFGSERPLIPADLVDTVATVDGVAEVIPEVSGGAQIVGADGDVVGGGAGGSFGQSWVPDDAGLDPFQLAEGERPEGEDEVAIDTFTAETGELGVGDTATVLTPAGSREMTISGIVTYGDADTVAGSSVLLFDLPTATALMGEEGKLSALYATAADGVDAETLTARIADVVPDGVEALTGQEAADATKDEIRTALGFLNAFLLTFALIALFVGSFIIYNTFSILVAQRSRENALLRAIGASRRQVLLAVLLESVAVGLVASVLGLVAGIGVAAGLKSVLAAIGLDLPGGGIAVEPRTIVMSLIGGLGVSVVSAVVPARRAARIPPIAALRDVSVDDSGRSRVRMVLGGAIAALGAVALAGGLAGDRDAGLVGLGATLVFVAVVVLGPILARPIVGLLGLPIARLTGMTGGLARQNALRNPKRTASTAAALMIGVTLVGGISIIAASTRASLDQVIERSFQGDFVVAASGFDGGGVSPQLADELGELPELAAVTGLAYGAVEIDGSTQLLVAADAASLDQVVDLGETEGSMADVGLDTVAIDRDRATDQDLALGDTVEATFATGPVTLEVAAIYTEAEVVGGLLVDTETLAAHTDGPLVDSQILATVADGVDLAAADAAIERVTEAYPQVTVQDREEYKDAQGATIDGLLNMIYALLALAVIIALIGIANTLALSILERTRELGLLRAVGMTRAQLRAMVRWEAVLISVLGAVLGLAVALLFGWSLVTALEDEGLEVFRVPITRLVVIVVLAGLAGVGASLLPARRAARLDVLKAVTAD